MAEKEFADPFIAIIKELWPAFMKAVILGMREGMRQCGKIPVHLLFPDLPVDLTPYKAYIHPSGLVSGFLDIEDPQKRKSRGHYYILKLAGKPCLPPVRRDTFE